MDYCQLNALSVIVSFLIKIFKYLVYFISIFLVLFVKVKYVLCDSCVVCDDVIIRGVELVL